MNKITKISVFVLIVIVIGWYINNEVQKMPKITVPIDNKSFEESRNICTTDNTTAVTTTSVIRVNKDFRVNKDLAPNHPPSFEVGKEYIYQANIIEKGVMYNLTQQYVVKGLELINKTKCYRIDYVYEYPLTETVIEYSITNAKEQPRKYEKVTVKKENRTAYINVNDGMLVDVIADGESIITQDINYNRGIWMYAPWMLSITNGKQWEVSEDTVVNGKVVETTIVSYKVSDNIEKINKRDCFKTEIRWGTKRSGEELKTINTTATMWIDVEKRILIKMEVYEGNLHTGGMSLVSEL